MKTKDTNKLSEGCILIKKKEYEDLIKENTTLKQKDYDNSIRILWDSDRSWYDRHSKQINLEGKYIAKLPEELMLSAGIKSQLQNILRILTYILQKRYEDKFKEVSEIEFKKYVSSTNYHKSKFSNLSLFARIFFKPEYID